ncbi:hypothetical protein BDM02DRAFT_950505 [Thelephora ganbajun]|uniref:Uncharacterized protein n=1 Tax=Thelephora ganbajun TaxID=370292 RepID=A0ACB6Z4J2_THEGA|nr:hypothetical protein BDM02DRAFT_950505 [Thelephora ganbajun]
MGQGGDYDYVSEGTNAVPAFTTPAPPFMGTVTPVHAFPPRDFLNKVSSMRPFSGDAEGTLRFPPSCGAGSVARPAVLLAEHVLRQAEGSDSRGEKKWSQG